MFSVTFIILGANCHLFSSNQYTRWFAGRRVKRRRLEPAFYWAVHTGRWIVRVLSIISGSSNLYRSSQCQVTSHVVLKVSSNYTTGLASFSSGKATKPPAPRRLFWWPREGWCTLHNTFWNQFRQGVSRSGRRTLKSQSAGSLSEVVVTNF